MVKVSTAEMSALIFIYICTSVFAQAYTFSSSVSGSRSPWHPSRSTTIRSVSGSPSGSVLPSILYTYPSSPSTTTSLTVSSTISPSITGTRLERVTVTQTVTQTVLVPVIITVTKTITVTVTLSNTVTPTLTPLVPLPGTMSSDQDYIIIIALSVVGFVVALVIVMLIVSLVIYKKNKASPMASSPKHVVYENKARFSVDSMPNWHTQTRDLNV